MEKMNNKLEKLLKDTRLSRSNLLVFLLLLANGNVWTNGQENMAESLNLSHRTVNRSVSELFRYGYLKKLRVCLSNRKVIKI